MSELQVGDRLIGDGYPCCIVAEIGINHNGDIDIARRLILAAHMAGCDAIKFQKRTVDVVYSPEELARPRESVFGITNGDLKHGLELSQDEYEQIDHCCKAVGMLWFASCWDQQSVDFIEQFDPPCYKIASASLTDLELIRRICATGKPLILSTGMSDLWQIGDALELIREIGNACAVLHCVSTYPTPNHQLNLRAIQTLTELMEPQGIPVGYSGHEIGLATTLAAVALGASIVERHVTLDRSMWGSDQAASIEPHALSRLVRDIRAIESAMGDGVKRVLPEELVVAEKLRRVR